MSLQIFVIFHKKTYSECYEKLPVELLQYLTFVAVNPDIEKTYPEGVKLIKEWELPIYDARYQRECYNENSVIFHLHLNGILKRYEYVGFCQYDMVLSDFTNILSNLNPAQYITHRSYGEKSDYSFCFITTWTDGIGYKVSRIIEYLFYTEFEHDIVDDKQYPLLNTYIISSEIFGKIVDWAMKIDKELLPFYPIEPSGKRGFIAGTYERVFALAVGELLERSDIVWELDHVEILKEGCYKK